MTSVATWYFAGDEPGWYRGKVNTRNLSALLLLALLGQPGAQAQTDVVGTSPWGPDDEIGTLNLMTDASRQAVLSRIRGGKVYDLGTEYFVGMPSFHHLHDPRYQYWLTHTPRGAVVDNPNGLGEVMNRKVSYTGDAISLYTHMGTHIDALNHFGLNGRIWNGFSADEHLGDKGWKKSGAETIPPIVARGVLIDLPAALNQPTLARNHRVTRQDLIAALARQQVTLQPGDVVLLRTGQMQHFHQPDEFLHDYPGISLDAAKWLVEEQHAMLLGADNLSFEAFPPERNDNWVPVHTYLLAERGVMFIENIALEALAADRVYTFAFIAASLKLRGASGAPMRPLAFPLR